MDAPTELNPLATGTIALAVAMHLLAKMVERGLLPEEEVVSLLTTVVNKFAKPEEQEEARRSIKTFMGNAPI